MAKKATFGAGCFWGVEAAYRQIPGVISTKVGYAGGDFAKPSYEAVCSGQTGHVEVVEVTFDESKLSYDDLLAVFWENHDPTQVNRQGPDIGTQYRTVIFFHDDEQEAAAKASKSLLDSGDRFPRPIATNIEPAPELWEAEDYHQQYLEKRGLSTCRI